MSTDPTPTDPENPPEVPADPDPDSPQVDDDSFGDAGEDTDD